MSALHCWIFMAFQSFFRKPNRPNRKQPTSSAMQFCSLHFRLLYSLIIAIICLQAFILFLAYDFINIHSVNINYHAAKIQLNHLLNGDTTTGSQNSGLSTKNLIRILKPEGTQDDIIGINTFPDLIKKFSIPKYNHLNLPRFMKSEDYDTLMRLVQLTTQILEQHNITSLLIYGSLIGSYLMHDILPWDDDVDIFIHNETKSQVMDIFKDDGHHGIAGYYVPDSPGKIFKIFFSSSKSAGTYPWKWPFIDILSYVEIDDMIQAVDDIEPIWVPKTSFYPLVKRPFGPLWLNSPKDPVEFLKRKYSVFSCTSGTWNHQKETVRTAQNTPCRLLQKYYPFIQRSTQGNRTVESLWLDKTRFYDIVIEAAYQSQASMYGW